MTDSSEKLLFRTLDRFEGKLDEALLTINGGKGRLGLVRKTDKLKWQMNLAIWILGTCLTALALAVAEQWVSARSTSATTNELRTIDRSATAAREGAFSPSTE